MFTTQELLSLNELELEVFRYVAANRQAVPYMRIRELAAEAHVSTTTVLRFCKKMGCDGYTEFKIRLKDELAQRPAVAPDPLDTLRSFWRCLEDGGFDCDLEDAAQLLARSENVLLFGVGNSGAVACYGARALANVGKFAVALADPFYPLDANGGPRTAVVLLSVSGETREVLDMASKARAQGNGIVVITANGRSQLSRMADVRLAYDLPVQRVGDFDRSSQVPPVALLEQLAHRLSERLAEE